MHHFLLAAIVIQQEMTKVEQQRYREASIATFDYLEENQRRLYIVGDPSVLAIDVARPIFEFVGDNNERWNLIGNWETYSKDYYNLMTYYKEFYT